MPVIAPSEIRLTEADVRALAQLLLEALNSPAHDGKDGPTTTVITIEHCRGDGATVDTPYMTLDQAAAYCHRSPKTLLNHHSLGTLRSVSASRPLLFRREDLDAWLTPRPKGRRK